MLLISKLKIFLERSSNLIIMFGGKDKEGEQDNLAMSL